MASSIIILSWLLHNLIPAHPHLSYILSIDMRANSLYSPASGHESAARINNALRKLRQSSGRKKKPSSPSLRKWLRGPACDFDFIWSCRSTGLDHVPSFSSSLLLSLPLFLTHTLSVSFFLSLVSFPLPSRSSPKSPQPRWGNAMA